MSNTNPDVPKLEIGRAYTANEAAAILGMSKGSFNERVREGLIKPVFTTGDRRFSGYVLARLLEWPLSDNPRDYMPADPKGLAAAALVMLEQAEDAGAEARRKALHGDL